MNETVRKRLTHAVLSLLLSAGIVLPVLGVLLPSMVSPAVAAPLLITVLFFELASLRRAAAVAGAALCVGGILFWLFGMGGFVTVSDVVIAIALRFSGVETALPLVAEQAALLLTVLITFICCLACLPDATCLPAAMLCVCVVLLIYLSGSAAWIPYLLPALAAMILLMMTDRFRETPVLPLAPWVAVMVAAAFLLASGGVGNNPLMEKADELRQAVLDRLFFTEPRDVFSLSSEGWYPEGQDQLGGKPNPDPRPVMQVSAPRTVYLRGVILNEYTGRSWRNTTGGRRWLWQSSVLSSRRAALFDQLLPPETARNNLCAPLQVSVRMLADSASTLFVPQRVRELIPGGDLVPYFSNASELFITRNLKPGDTYSVTAPLFQAGDPGLSTLIEICSTLEDSQFDQVTETYTSLPSHLEEPVYALAREAASVAEGPYEKAMAIQTWLSRSFRYTLDVADQSGDMDFVTSFLLDTREGYCTYFASAMTVLCRMVGLPARYVEGYVAQVDENGEAIVTGESAHAWTEVYFKGFGWLTFDATPRERNADAGGSGQSTPEPGAEPTPTPTPEPPEDQENQPTGEPESESEPSPEPTPEPTPEPSPEPSADPSEEPSESPASPDAKDDPREEPNAPEFPWPWLLLLLALLLIALRILITSPSFRARRARDEEARLEIWAGEIFEMLRAEGFVRNKDESPMAFCRRVDQTSPFSVNLGPVGECLSLLRYSRARAQETDTRLLQDTALLLRGELSRPARLRCFLRRFFLPQKQRAYSGSQL